MENPAMYTIYEVQKSSKMTDSVIHFNDEKLISITISL